MVVSKNKCPTKGGKKTAMKKVFDPFSKKDWYDLKAPAKFNIRNTGSLGAPSAGGPSVPSPSPESRAVPAPSVPDRDPCPGLSGSTPGTPLSVPGQSPRGPCWLLGARAAQISPGPAGKATMVALRPVRLLQGG